jgi:MFS family permease
MAMSLAGDVLIMFVRDMFFLHERARKINLWASFVILSPYFGSLITAFIITTESWRWAFGLYTMMTGLCLIAQIAFGEETFYDRDLPQADRRVPRPGTSGRMLRIIGIDQWSSRKQRNSFVQAVSRPVRVLVKPTIFLSTVYYLLTFAWVVGINTTLSIFITAPPYNFGTKSIGFFYFTPVIAAILGEVLG